MTMKVRMAVVMMFVQVEMGVRRVMDRMMVRVLCVIGGE